MTTTKPTINSGDVAAMRAVQQWDNYRVLPTASGWAVLNRKSGDRYSVKLDGSCDCPHAQKVNKTGAVCKHFKRACLEEQLKAMVNAPAPVPYCDHCGAELGNPHCPTCRTPSSAELDAAAAARRAKFFAPD